MPGRHRTSQAAPEFNQLLTTAIESCSRRDAWLPDITAALMDVIAFERLGLAHSDLFQAAQVELDTYRGANLESLRDCQRRVLGSIPKPFCESIGAALASLRRNHREAAPLRLVVKAVNCLDSVFYGLASDPLRMTYSERYLEEYRRMLRDGDGLLRNVRGYLLPRAVAAVTPPRSTGDFYKHVVRVVPPSSCTLDYALEDLTNSRADNKLRVGWIPVLRSADELEWSEDAVRGTYRTKVRLAEESSIGQRMVMALDWLAARDVDVVVLPELSSSDGLLRQLRRWRAKRHSTANPRVIVAGSYLCQSRKNSSRLANRAHVVGRSGSALWEQDKMNPYTFKATHQLDAGNPLKLAVPRDLVEDIDQESATLVVRDTLSGERIAVLICEDFARDLPHRQMVVELGVNRVFVPIMNGPRGSGDDWVRQYGFVYAAEPGSLSIVCNSAALVNVGSRQAKVQDLAFIADPKRQAALASADVMSDGGHIQAVSLTVNL